MTAKKGQGIDYKLLDFKNTNNKLFFLKKKKLNLNLNKLIKTMTCELLRCLVNNIDKYSRNTCIIYCKQQRTSANSTWTLRLHIYLII